MRLPIYFDYAATTPLDAKVAEIMARYLTIVGDFGNPASTTHCYGESAAAAVKNASEQVAHLINAHPQEIIWTSGATEANNLAIRGLAAFYADKGKHIVTCKTEHKSVLDSCRYLEKQGYHITYLQPETTGLIDLEKLKAAITHETLLVSIMHVNNEIGVIQDIAAIGDLCRERGVYFHVDAVQSIGKLPIDLQQLPIDLLSLSAHKVYGPKGIGALYVRSKPKVRLQPLIYGGGQQQGLRAGTLATHQIVGMGEAFAIANQVMADEMANLQQLRDRLWHGIQTIPQVFINGTIERRIGNNLNIRVGHVDGVALVKALKDIALSMGSSCTSTSIEPSYVLRALGLTAKEAHSSLRITLGRYTTQAEIDFAIRHIRTKIEWLRSLSPLWGDHVTV